MPELQWHLGGAFVQINGGKYYLWKAVDLDGEILECYVSKILDKKSEQKFIIKSLKKH